MLFLVFKFKNQYKYCFAKVPVSSDLVQQLLPELNTVVDQLVFNKKSILLRR